MSSASGLSMVSIHFRQSLMLMAVTSAILTPLILQERIFSLEGGFFSLICGELRKRSSSSGE
jgi:hypothetical protein